MKKQKNYLGLLVPLGLILLWELLSYFHLFNELFIPNPIAIGDSVIRSLVHIHFLENIAITVYRVLVAFAASIVIGVPIGMLMGYYKKIYDSLEFIVEFFRSIPATALFPLFLFFFGTNELSKIASAIFGGTLIIVVNTMAGVRFANKLRIQSAKVYKAKGFKLFRYVLLPEALPAILTGFRISFSICFVIIILVEMFIGTNLGLGRVIIDAQQVYEIPNMYAAIFITGVIGFLGNKLLYLTEKKVLHYTGR